MLRLSEKCKRRESILATSTQTWRSRHELEALHQHGSEGRPIQPCTYIPKTIEQASNQSLSKSRPIFKPFFQLCTEWIAHLREVCHTLVTNALCAFVVAVRYDPTGKYAFSGLKSGHLKINDLSMRLSVPLSEQTQ